MRTMLLASAAVLVLGLFSNSASAAGQMACSERTDVLKQLSDKYKEAPSAFGLANNGGLIEVLTSDDGLSWTIIMSMPNGTSCLLAAGENWQSIEKIANGPEINTTPQQTPPPAPQVERVPLIDPTKPSLDI